MKVKPARTLADYASEAARTAGGIECPSCGCRDFRVYRTTQGQSATVRYKVCRHCGKKVLTSTESAERIIRDVNPHDQDEDDGDPIVLYGT